MKHIVVFDTGTGGRLFAEYLKNHLPDTVKITTAIDSASNTYGNKQPSEICRYTHTTIKPYIGKADIIVLACNTATANCIDQLRTTYPDQQFVGFEPMIKPAARLTKNGVVVVLATKATKNSARYKKLKDTYAKNFTILEPDCSTWAAKIDAGTFTNSDINKSLKSIVPQNPDLIMLSCTHYLAIKDQIAAKFPNAQIIDPFKSVTTHIKTLLNLN